MFSKLECFLHEGEARSLPSKWSMFSVSTLFSNNFTLKCMAMTNNT